MLKHLIIAGILVIPSLSFAETKKGGLFIEPVLTYETGEGEVNMPAPLGKADTETDGFGVGARLGFHVLESVFIGADGRYSMPNFKDDALDLDTDATAWNLGPVVGVQMPTTLGIRLWGTYIMTGELDPDKHRNINVRFSEAQGYRLGGGIKVGYVSLNVEYEKLTYDDFNVDEVGSFSPGSSFSNVELDNSSWIFSVSFPISL